MSNDNKNCGLSHPSAVGHPLRERDWYAAGLHFECLQCGNCCSGPAEGYIWVSGPEMRLIAKHLNISPRELKKKYLRRVGFRRSIIENAETYDCIFLRDNGKGKACSIYPVRPTQCRSWPFWSYNMASPDCWNMTGQKCPGINRGKFYDIEQIRAIKNAPKWWREW